MRASLLLFTATALLAGCSSSAPNDSSCSAADHSALTVCAAGPTVKGIDVSTYQGQVNWTSAKSSGLAFAIARVSDGTTHVDDQFARNWPGMKAAGLIRGAYQFFRPGEDPIAQADLVVSKLNAAGGLASDDLPVVMDMETADGVAPATIQANMHKWLDHVEQATGKKPIIYTANFMSGNIGTGFTAYPLWVANYGATCPLMPSNFTQWKMWQYSSTGTVPGISGNVDMDEFNGTLAQLTTFAGGGAPPPPHDAGTPPPPPHDAGTPPHDAGTPPHDAGATPEDAGSTLGSGGNGTPDGGAASGTNPCAP